MELQATLKVGKTKMSVIKVHPGELVPWFVLGLFAGLRPEETVRLDWADIDFDRRQIDLPAKKTSQRYLKFSDFLNPAHSLWVAYLGGFGVRSAALGR